MKNIQESLTILKTVKVGGLEDKLTENQLAKLIDVCLMKRDNREFLKVWAEKRRNSKLSSTRTEFGGSSDSEDDVELEVDFDRTIKIETEVGTLSEKRDGKIFRVIELSDSDNDQNDEESIFSIAKGEKPYVKRTTKNPGQNGKFQNCPLDCPDKTHINGSTFFCKVFKNKSREE